jgi:hypothetical protein
MVWLLGFGCFVVCGGLLCGFCGSVCAWLVCCLCCVWSGWGWLLCLYDVVGFLVVGFLCCLVLFGVVLGWFGLWVCVCVVLLVL